MKFVFLQGAIGAPRQMPFASLPGGCWLLILEMTMANILVIDDQPYVRQLISEELILEGHQVHGLSNAELVREYLQISQPDLILLDLYLDGPEGFMVLEDIKFRNPELPVIIVTAYDGFIGDPRLQKADGYVVKSVDLTDLKRKIRQVLGQTLMN